VKDYPECEGREWGRKALSVNCFVSGIGKARIVAGSKGLALSGEDVSLRSAFGNSR
jgi:hypothetical protein